jgi:hypothetical protein
MKKCVLFLLIIMAAASSAHSQSLKDMLYSGKLKKDSNIVIRKGEDLSSRIDTSTKKPEPEVVKVAVPATDSSGKANPISGSDVVVSNASTEPGSTTDAASAGNASKNNNQLLKTYMDSLVSEIKTEALSSKKIKKDTYYVYVDYEIGVDGEVGVLNITVNPESEFLQNQVKERMLVTPLELAPVLDSSNKPRKVKRKYNFSITKQ